MTLFAVHQRIGETSQMSGCYPRLRIHQDRAVYTHIIFIVLYKLLPPGLLDVILQLYTERAVIPGIGQSPVNLGSGEHKPA